MTAVKIIAVAAFVAFCCVAFLWAARLDAKRENERLNQPFGDIPNLDGFDLHNGGHQ